MSNTNYIGKVCPFCKTEFTETDDVVVCSECDMPHHKECWVQNQGCTTFGCLGTIKAPDGEVDSVTADEVNFDETPKAPEICFCTACGAKNFKTNSFCSNCGKSMKAPEPTTNYSQPSAPTPQFNSPGANGYNQSNTGYNQSNGGYGQSNTGYNQSHSSYGQYNNANGSSSPIDMYIEQLKASILAPDQVSPDAPSLNQMHTNEETVYLGSKSNYYFSKFAEMRNKRTMTSWNWSAFLVPAYWFAYRKMYGHSALIMGLTWIISNILPGLSTLASIAVWVAAGLLGNYCYMQKFDIDITKIRTLSDPQRAQYMFNQGGTSSKAVWIAIGVMVVLNLASNFV